MARCFNFVEATIRPNITLKCAWCSAVSLPCNIWKISDPTIFDIVSFLNKIVKICVTLFGFVFSVSKMIWNQFKWKYENIIISLHVYVLFYVLLNPFLARKGYAVFIFWLEFVCHLKWSLKYKKIGNCLKCLCNQFLFRFDTQYVMCLLNSANWPHTVHHQYKICCKKAITHFKFELHWSAEVLEPRNTLRSVLLNAPPNTPNLVTWRL